MTASIRAFDCLNPRLLSAQPWELLRIPLVGPEARTSSVPMQLSLLLAFLGLLPAGTRLMMSKTLPRDAGVMGPAFVHGNGSTGKSHPHQCGIPFSWATHKHAASGRLAPHPSRV